jgi:hypothetical protein
MDTQPGRDDTDFCLHVVSRHQLETAERQRERVERAALERSARAQAKVYADGLRESFCLRGSDRPADDVNQRALF